VAGSRLARKGSPRVLARECRCRWVICSLLFLATTVNDIDRQILALVKEFLDRELGWSNEQFGLVNSAFLFALCIVPILALTMVGDWPAVLLIGLAGAAHQAWSANLFTTVSDMFPKKDVGIHHMLAPRLDPLTLPE